MRRRLLATSVALACAVLTGCASIPSSGPVQGGERAPADPANEVNFLVPNPSPGATQEEILNGFIRAALNPNDDYQVARAYLTTAFADEWQADAAVTIDVLADREISIVDDTTMRVDAAPAASLRENGQYEEPDSRSAIPLRYEFEQVDGEWRISMAPTGILIDEAFFRQVFQKYTVYFLDPTDRYFVPDVRWYAVRDSAQTSIVQAMIAGAAEWLAPGVATAFPEGVQLEPAAVPVTDGVARVSLTGAAFDDPSTVQRMQAQLDASLIGINNITDVVLRLNGVESEVPALADRPTKNPIVDPRTAVFDGETFGYLATSGESIEPITGLSAAIAAMAPTGAALGPDGESAAVRNADGVSIVRAGDDPELLDPRDGLVTPAIDGEGVVWSVPADAPDELAWFAPDGSGQVAAPWSGSQIAAIEVSRDSTRIIALLGDGARTHFIAASIRRNADGHPEELGAEPLRLDDISGTPLDVAWLDARTVASITAMPDGTTRVVTQELGGFAIQRSGPLEGVAIDGGNNDLRALTSNGELEVRSGVGWQPRASGIRFMAAQQ